MTEYWVFQDKSFKRACYRSNCSVRRGALELGRSEGTWHGAYSTYEEARRTAAVMSPKKGAQLNCRLAIHKISKGSSRRSAESWKGYLQDTAGP
jgi:hypothetical protein